MVKYKYSEPFTNDSVDKQVKIEYDGGIITNTELFSESMELTESLCSESELRFGCCEASVFKLKVANIMQPLIGKWLTVSMTLDGNTDVPFQFGKYKVYSDKPTADRKHREIVAYDAMYDIINADVADWYNTILPNTDSKVTLKEFRTSFISYFGLKQEEIDLVNDSMVIEKTIEPSEISGKDVITAICEINGCFGHIGRNGKFKYVYLDGDIQGLYPADNLFPDHAPEYLTQAETGHLYPQDPKSSRVGSRGNYISCKYEDFLVKSINKLQIRQEENDIGTIVGEGGDNCYIIEDNFLVYGKSADDLWQIANNIFNKIIHLIYRPYELELRGNPCLEVGDSIRVSTRYEIVEGYILKRTLKGIQALRDSYSADGEEYRNENVNGIQRSIIQLKGKTNILVRTVDETRSTLEDADKGLHSEIVQTAGEIRSEVQNTKEGLQSQITQTAGEIRSEVSQTYETKTDAAEKKTALESKITQTATEIQSTVSATYETKSDAGEKTKTLQSQITQNATEITSKVSKTDYNGNEIASLINQSATTVEIKAKKINLNGAVTANNNVKISKDGKITAKNANIEGTIISTNAVLSGNVTVEGTIISSNATITGGRIIVDTADSTNDNVKFNYDGITVWMGSFGFQSAYGSQKAQMQYNEIYMESPATGGTGTVHIKATEQCTSSFGWGTSSDRRLKKNIADLDKEKTAKFIYSLKPSEYVYVYDDKGTLRHGLIAQDVLAAMGDETWGLYGEQEERDGSRYATLDYSELIPDLIATVQIQKEEIESLKNDVEELKSQILKLSGGNIYE